MSGSKKGTPSSGKRAASSLEKTTPGGSSQKKSKEDKTTIENRETFLTKFPEYTVNKFKIGDFVLPKEFKVTEDIIAKYFEVTGLDLIVTRDVIKLGGEKILHFLIMDLLKYPLLLLQSDESQSHPKIITPTEDLVSVLEEQEKEEEDFSNDTTATAKRRLFDPVEFLVKEGNRIPFVIKVTANLPLSESDSVFALWQLLGELLAAFKMNDDNRTVYGALTSMDKWIFVKMEVSDFDITVSISKDIAFCGIFFGPDNWEGCITTSGLVISYLLYILRISFATTNQLSPNVLIDNIISAKMASQDKLSHFVSSLIDTEKRELIAEKIRLVEEYNRVSEENIRLKQQLAQLEKSGGSSGGSVSK